MTKPKDKFFTQDTFEKNRGIEQIPMYRVSDLPVDVDESSRVHEKENSSGEPPEVPKPEPVTWEIEYGLDAGGNFVQRRVPSDNKYNIVEKPLPLSLSGIDVANEDFKLLQQRLKRN